MKLLVRHTQDNKHMEQNRPVVGGAYGESWGQLQQYGRAHPYNMAQALENRQRYSLQNTPQRAEIHSNSLETMVDRAVIDGDPYTINGQNYTLVPEALKQAGLEPRHELMLGDKHIGISHIFKARGYKTAIAYVEGPDGRVNARSYYQSRSSGLWRYLPDYAADEAGYASWFGKAYGEESTTLPFELQRALNRINEQGITGTQNIDPNYIFFGTAKRYPSKLTYKQLLDEGKMRGDFYQEVNRTPAYNFGKLSYEKHPPEYIDVSGPEAPNFRGYPATAKIYSQLHGEAIIEAFPSLDGSLRYLMCKVGSPPMAWVGNIEAVSPITSTGCCSEWVSMGDIGTPLYEYKAQTDGYGDAANGRASYQSMWKYYLSRTPIIRRYLQMPDEPQQK